MGLQELRTTEPLALVTLSSLVAAAVFVCGGACVCEYLYVCVCVCVCVCVSMCMCV